MRVEFSIMQGRLGICRLDPHADLPSWAFEPGFCSVTRTAHEVSVICSEKHIPPGTRCEAGWRGLRIHGPFEFSEIGVLSSVAGTLARAGISLLAVSTFDTDYILIQEHDLERARDSLRSAGHVVLDS